MTLEESWQSFFRELVLPANPGIDAAATALLKQTFMSGALAIISIPGNTEKAQRQRVCDALRDELLAFIRGGERGGN